MAVTGLVSVYGRPEAYFLDSSSRTTAGLWLQDGQPEKLDRTAASAALGAAILRILDRSRLEIAHPSQDEWSEQRRAMLDPLVKLARMRSWREFVRDVTLVSVEKEDEDLFVTLQHRDSKRLDVFHPGERTHLASPDATSVGTVVSSAMATT